MRAWTRNRSPGVILRYPSLQLWNGTQLTGMVVGVNLTPEELLADQERAVAEIVKAGRLLQDWGATCLGLGAVVAVVGGRGRAVADAFELPVTTGHALTTYAAMRTLELVSRHIGLAPGEPVTILGAPGPVALGLAACLGQAGREVRLVLDPLPPPIGRYLNSFPTIRVMARAPALAEARLLLGASSTGDSLREGELRSGAVLVDVAQPRDLVRPLRRRDVLVVDGELLSLPPGTVLDPLTRLYNRIVGQGARHVLACFAEPMILAGSGLSRVAEQSRYRRFPDPAWIQTVGNHAENLGFRADQLFARGRPLLSSAFGVRRSVFGVQ